MSLKAGELIELIGYWFDDTGLTEKSSVGLQAEKVCEEHGEFQRAVGSGKREKIIDELGDLFVTCIGECRQLEVSTEEVLYMAYRKILDRLETGKLINGKFIKKEDL